MVVTDKQGHRYYDVEEAMQVLGVKRTTFQQKTAKLTKYRREGTKKLFYRVEDIEALKEQPAEMWPVSEEKTENEPAAGVEVPAA